MTLIYHQVNDIITVGYKSKSHLLPVVPYLNKDVRLTFDCLT